MKINFKPSKKFFIQNIIISLFYSVDILLWNKGLESIPVNNGIIIMLLIPIWLSVMSRIFLKEKDFTLFHLVSLFLCFFAVIFSIKDQIKTSVNFNYGYLIILINTFVVALSLVLQKKYKDKRSISYSLILNSIVCFVLFFIINYIQSSRDNFFDISNVFVKYFNKDVFFMALIIAFFDIIEYFSVYMAYKLYPIASLQPIRFTRIVISGILSYLFLSETITLNQFISIAIIILRI